MNPENPYQQPQTPTPPTPPAQPPFQPQPFSSPAPQYPPQPAPQAPPSPLTPHTSFNQPEATPAAPGEQYSVDYLNQIAPQQQKSINRFAIFGLIGGILIAVLAVFIMIANAGGPDVTTQAKSIQARISTLQGVTGAEQINLKENTINEANASLSSALTSMNTDLTTIMKAKGLTKSTSTTAAVSKTEKAYAADLQKKLDDSYQRGTLDRTYTSQMTYELSLLRSKLLAFKNTANSKSISAFCDTSITNVDTILKTFDNFSATK